MLLNYFLLSFRHLFHAKGGRFPVFTIINLTGLAVGLAAFLLILHFVRYESSYDRFLSGAERTYRVTVKKTEQGQTGMHSAKTYAGMAQLLREEVPEVETAARILAEECLLHYKPAHRKFNNQKTYWADPELMHMLALTFVLTGDTSMLRHPNHAVLSYTAARRLFGDNWEGDHSPVGKTIWLNEGVPFMIQGVYADLPASSHMEVDFVVSYSTLTSLIGPVMETALPPHGNFVYTYIQLRQGADTRHVQASVNNALLRKIPDNQRQTADFLFELQSVPSIHLTSDLADELKANGSRLFVVSLTLAAVLILVIAWVNFINLTTARAMERAREVGVRKALGAARQQLIGQFITECFTSSLLATLLALGLAWLLVPAFLRFTEIGISPFSSGQATLWLLFGASMLLGALISSIYPAWVLSGFQPTLVLKGKIYHHSGSAIFRHGLITFQFFTALLLLCMTGAIFYQIRYMRDQPLGIATEEVLVIHSPRSMIGNATRDQRFKTFRDQVLAHPAIEAGAASGCLPGKAFLYHREEVSQPGVETGSSISYDLASVDEGYLQVLGTEILAGRNFSEARDERKTVIINQLASKQLEFVSPQDAVNQKIKIGSEEREIIGVVADAHYQGLQKPIQPLLLYYGHDYEFGFFSFRLQSYQVHDALSFLEAEWQKQYPNDPFDYFFLDDFFDRQYQSELAFARLFSVFAGLAIFIACLGLFGLVSFTSFQKTKEIGIRKVLGASVLQILILLSKQFFKYILMALAIGLPLSHLLVGWWLGTFAYHFQVGWWMYMIPVGIILIVALLAMSGQSLRAALANPVHALKDE